MAKTVVTDADVGAFLASVEDPVRRADAQALCRIMAEETFYLMAGMDEHAHALARLGPHRTGRACLYLTRLERVDEGVPRALVRDAYAAARAV